jgi:hypothetical protein
VLVCLSGRSLIAAAPRVMLNLLGGSHETARTGELPYGSYVHKFGGRVLVAWTEAIDNIVKAAAQDPFKVVSITGDTVVWNYTPWNAVDQLRLMPCVYRLK